MKSTIIIIAVVAIIAAALGSLYFFGFFDSILYPFQSADDSGFTQEGTSSVVNANNKFAFELYSKLNDNESNIFFSPYSISDALAMTYEGARGKTACEMQSVFHFPQDDSTRQSSFAYIYNMLNGRSNAYTLRTANALWVQKDFSLLQSYINITDKFYRGKATNLDFIKDTEGSRKTINSWVEQQTNNKIQDLIPVGYIDSLTRLVLTNAIYFKGTWVIQFDKSETRPGDFHVSPEKTVSAQMMSLTGEKAEFNYTETSTLQALEMPYKGGNLSMVILLPKEGNMTSLENSLTSEKLNAIESKFMKQRVDVHMPKFKFDTKYFMADTLSGMGMPTAFTLGVADFSGMDGSKDLYISSVIHQAYVDVNEEGTEAAAATAVVMTMAAAGPHPVFNVDHPFIFIIQEKNTGAILFMGKMVDPTK
jgi:serpin B